MVITLLCILTVVTWCSSDGNVHLMEEDIAVALRSCYVSDKANENASRQRRSSDNATNDPIPRIDSYTKLDNSDNQYYHERRNNTPNVTNGSNAENNEYDYRTGDGVNVNAIPRIAVGSNHTKVAYAHTNSTRAKRNDPLINKSNNEQVDSRGIPREAELWNKVQLSVTSQQSRILLKDQIHACFQELQSESEDNGCYYSNKLERCLMLGFSDRKVNNTRN